MDIFSRLEHRTPVKKERTKMSKTISLTDIVPQEEVKEKQKATSTSELISVEINEEAVASALFVCSSVSDTVVVFVLLNDELETTPTVIVIKANKDQVSGIELANAYNGGEILSRFGLEGRLAEVCTGGRFGHWEADLTKST